MKRWILCLAVIAALLLTACGGAQTPAPTAAPTEPPTQLHTVAPGASGQEPEWASVECMMTLEDDDNLYAKGSDFVSFALIGGEDAAELRFRLDEVTATMLRDQSKDNAYYVTMDDQRIGDVVLNESCDELTLVGDRSYEELCTLANRIRGLE